MRELLLLRHGEAEEHAVGGDAARPLTPLGRAAALSVGRALAAWKSPPDVVWHSPYLRAVQTARAVSEACGGLRLVEHARITPAGPARAVAEELLAERGSILVVSHLPFLPALAMELLGGPAQLHFRPATLARLLLPGHGAAVLDGLWAAQDLASVG